MRAMNLPDYIEKIGIEAFAEKFGITERAARAYKERRRRPRPELAEQIVGKSPVTWEGIYRPNPPSRRSEARA